MLLQKISKTPFAYHPWKITTEFLDLISQNQGTIAMAARKHFAAKAFNVSSNYDTAIFNYFNADQDITALKISQTNANVLRYGENPHQKGFFFGDFDQMFDKLHGKELSYNNLLMLMLR